MKTKSQFWTLFKNDVMNLFSITVFSKRKNKVAKKKGTWGIILFIGLMYLGFGYYSFIMTGLGKSGGVNDVGLYFGISMGTLMALVFTFSNAHAVLFKSKDYDLLMCLPIEEYKIVTSKLMAVSLIGYLYFSFAFFPALLFYLLLIDFNIAVLLFGILIFIINPMLVLSISSFLSLLFARITSKMKNKNIVSSILYLAFFALIFIFAFRIGNIGGSVDEMNEVALAMQSSFSKIYPLSTFCVDAILGDFVSLLIVFGICIVPFIIFIIVCSKMYARFNTLDASGYKNKNFKLKEEKTSTPVGALLKKELQVFVGTPIYLTNYIVGPIMGAVVLIVASVYLSKQAMIFGEIPLSAGAKTAIALAISVFSFGLVQMTSVGINMEGKYFWLLKALPISEKMIFFSKVLFNIIVYGIFMVASLIPAVIILKLPILNCIIVFITPFVYVLAYSFVGLLLNIKFYNIEWTNATQAVKQGAGLLLSMLIDMGISMTTIIILIASLILEIDLSVVTLCIGLFFAFLFGRLLFTKGVKGFGKIA
ncbi:MAG: hypothetical protein IJS58_07580 [Bacilli bacterium]|nr:hypothetical protein [Bacilli bacterium]